MHSLRRLCAAATFAAVALAATPTLASAASKPTFATCNPSTGTAVVKAGGTITRTDGILKYKGGSFVTVAHPITLRLTGKVWVYKTRPNFGSYIYACDKATHRARLLWVQTGGADVTDILIPDRDIAVAGTTVGYHVQASSDENYDRFRSIDVATGKLLRDSGRIERAAGNAPPSTPIGVSKRGAMIVLEGTKLIAIDAAKDNRVLATTDAGPITFVGISNNSAHWNQGGTRHTSFLN